MYDKLHRKMIQANMKGFVNLIIDKFVSRSRRLELLFSADS